MKLKKATLPKRVKASRPLADYYEALKEEGYTLLGSGAFAKVFGKKDHVIKVAIDSPNYEQFISYVLANQDNPHFPKIVSVHRYKLHKDDIPPSDYEHDVWYDERVKGATAVVVKMERLKEFDWDSSWKHSSRFESAAYGDDIIRKSMSPHELQASRVLRKVFSLRGASDLGGNNLMRRKGTPVITDPVYG